MSYWQRRIFFGISAVVALSAVLTACSVHNDAASPVAVEARAFDDCQQLDGRYTVRKGDSLESIATRCHVSVVALVTANPVFRGKIVQPGNTLRLPNGTDDGSYSSLSVQPQRGNWLLPTNAMLLAGYSQAHPRLIFAGTTNDAVQAVHNGVVAYVGRLPAYGKLVIIRHTEGQQAVFGVYAGVDAITVAVGDRIQAGTRVASLGNSPVIGGNGLLFEVRIAGSPVDPRGYIRL